MTYCPHDNAELNADGTCPRKSAHVKARTGVACPLCGGKAHAREVNATAQDLDCAWRQFTRYRGNTGMLPLDSVNARAFAAWLDASRPIYGKAAQYQALAAAGTPISEAMAKDAAKYTPGAPVVVQATTVAAPVAEAQHTAAQIQETCPCGKPTGSAVCATCSGPLCADCAVTYGYNCYTCAGKPPRDCALPQTRPPTPAVDPNAARKARLRQALAS